MCKYDLITDSVIENIKPFYAFDKNGTIIRKFISLKNAFAFCGKSGDCISKCLSGDLKSAYGYV